MKKAFPSIALLIVVGCTPSVSETPAQPLVTARFDPSQTPPVLPTPNDLALDPTTGLLHVTVPPGASAADQELAAYLNSIQGFPPDSTALATFSGRLDPNSVTMATVRVIDRTTKTLVSVTPGYADTGDPTAPGRIAVGPIPGGWVAGHDYGIALIGGANGLKGADGQRVAGTPSWALASAKNPLVTCQDLTSPDCRATTDVIPSSKIDPAERLADQTQKAIQLEKLRRQLVVPLIEDFEAQGVDRNDLALAWSFRVVSFATLVYQPSAIPPQIPVPNDLAIDPKTGKVAVPIDPSTSAAQQELVRDYLNTLDGFPTQSIGHASVTLPGLDPASVGATTVQVLDTGGAAPKVTPTYNATNNVIDIAPPTGGWTKGHTYAVVVVGGPKGVKSATAGQPVIASGVWVLARSKNTLVTCTDLTSATCQPTVTLAPLLPADAVKLEKIRLGFAPLLDSFEAKGVPRSEMLVAWTFTILSQAGLTFDLNPDPAKSILPFPNDLVRSPATGLVDLPVPDGGTPQQIALANGLNTLDGFSTTAPIVSENGLDAGALDDGKAIDPATLDGGVGLFNMNPQGEAPSVVACLDCASSDGGTTPKPQTLELVPLIPLTEKTPYAAFVTTSLKDTTGKPVAPTTTFALVRSAASLVDAKGHSQVADVTDEQARRLEPIRAGLKPLFDQLASKGIPRSQLGLAWSFTTESTVTKVAQAEGAPAALGVPDTPVVAPTEVTDLATLFGTIAHDSVGKAWRGAIRVAFLLTGQGGTLDPAVLVAHTKAPTLQEVPFILTVPASANTKGYPIVIFGHGIGRARTDMLAIANALAAAGFATIAIDEVWHGERTTCTGAHALVPGCTGASETCDALAACADPSATCTGGRCSVGDFARGAGGVPTVSGWNFIDPSNLFGTRDNSLQAVADFAQISRVVTATGTGSLSATTAKLDASSITFAGQSLGAMLGMLYTSAAPRVQRAVFNVPGGDLPAILLTSTRLEPLRIGLFTGLRAQGIEPGTAAFDQFIATAKWILDPADPLNSAREILNGPESAATGRAALLQYIQNDRTIPNLTTLELIASANRPSAPKKMVIEGPPGAFTFTPPAPDANPHGFLLDPSVVGTGTTAKAQGDAARFLATGAL